MKNLILAAVLAITTAAASLSAHAGPIQVMDPGFQSQNLIYSPNAEAQLDPVCYGCTSSVTGLPRTEYVRPHVRSNGTSVQGYYRSRR